MSSGYTPGMPRLGVPVLLMSDSRLGVINPGFHEDDTATALPANIALGSSFNSDLARTGGPMIALGARSRGGIHCPASGRHQSRSRPAQRASSIFWRIRYCVPYSLLSRSTGYRARA
jgi:hypothetical protein